jgi:hypothetical protein
VPPRVQIDGNVAGPIAYGRVRPHYSVVNLIYGVFSDDAHGGAGGSAEGRGDRRGRGQLFGP